MSVGGCFLLEVENLDPSIRKCQMCHAYRGSTCQKLAMNRLLIAAFAGVMLAWTCGFGVAWYVVEECGEIS